MVNGEEVNKYHRIYNGYSNLSILEKLYPPFVIFIFGWISINFYQKKQNNDKNVPKKIADPIRTIQKLNIQNT